MKNFNLSVTAVLAMSAFAMAGGDIAPVVEPVVEVVAPAADDSGFYIGGAYSMASAESDYEWWDYERNEYDGTGNGETDYDAVMLQVGYKYNKYLAIEGRYWSSVGDGDGSYSEEWDDRYGDGYYDSGSGDDGDLTAWGIYVKPMYPVTEAFDVYALLGYGNVTLSDNGGDWLDESGFQWGVGAAYSFTENLSVFVDYVRLYDDTSEDIDKGWWGSRDDITVDTWNLGLTYKF